MLTAGSKPRYELRSRCCAAPVRTDVEATRAFGKLAVRCVDCGRPCETVEVKAQERELA
jgi:hypothetical protein